MSAKVKDVMTRNVFAVTKTTSFKDMAAWLDVHRQDIFPVLDDHGTVIGVVSEADMLVKEALDGGQAVQGGPAAGALRRREQAKAAGLTAGDLMTMPPVTIGPGDRVADAARLMYARGVRQLPVIDQTGHLAGLVSRADVLSVYTRPDEEIRRQITDSVLRDHFRADPARFTVTVTDGVVTLEGHLDSIAAGRGIVAEIRRLEGVVAVLDRLTWPVTRISTEP
jgi:CBS domain-containing protein